MACGERHDYMPATDLLAETWQPHRWVIDAMLLAANEAELKRDQYRAGNTELLELWMKLFDGQDICDVQDRVREILDVAGLRREGCGEPHDEVEVERSLHHVGHLLDEGFQRGVLEDLDLHRRVEKTQTVAAHLLGLVHGGVGVAQQCVGVAVTAAGNPSATVEMKIGQYLPVAT